jgi:CRISPR/Cas system CSM-associated protein Csm5 (group 7 of RAMP superfamily)
MALVEKYFYINQKQTAYTTGEFTFIEAPASKAEVNDSNDRAFEKAVKLKGEKGNWFLYSFTAPVKEGEYFSVEEVHANLMDNWEVVSQKKYEAFVADLEEKNRVYSEKLEAEQQKLLDEATKGAKDAGWSDEMIEAGFGRKI